jgi:hypothetical protein
MIKYTDNFGILIYKCDICGRTWNKYEDYDVWERRGIKPWTSTRNNTDYHLCCDECYRKWDESTPKTEENLPGPRACQRCGCYNENNAWSDTCPDCQQGLQNSIKYQKNEERFILSRNVGLAIGIFATIISGWNWVMGIIVYIASGFLIYILIWIFSKIG